MENDDSGNTASKLSSEFSDASNIFVLILAWWAHILVHDNELCVKHHQNVLQQLLVISYLYMSVYLSICLKWNMFSFAGVHMILRTLNGKFSTVSIFECGYPFGVETGSRNPLPTVTSSSFPFLSDNTVTDFLRQVYYHSLWKGEMISVCI